MPNGTLVNWKYLRFHQIQQSLLAEGCSGSCVKQDLISIVSPSQHHTQWCNKFNLFLGHLFENLLIEVLINLCVDDSYMLIGDVVRDTSLSLEARGERSHKGDPHTFAHDLTGVLGQWTSSSSSCRLFWHLPY